MKLTHWLGYWGIKLAEAASRASWVQHMVRVAGNWLRPKAVRLLRCEAKRALRVGDMIACKEALRAARLLAKEGNSNAKLTDAGPAMPGIG